MNKQDIIKQISGWKKGKWDKDYLYEMLCASGADNLRDISPEAVAAYYEKVKGEREDGRQNTH